MVDFRLDGSCAVPLAGPGRGHAQGANPEFRIGTLHSLSVRGRLTKARKATPRSSERGVEADLSQSPLALRPRDQIRVKVSASSSSNRLA